MDVNEELKLLLKLPKKKVGDGEWGSGPFGGGRVGVNQELKFL